MFEKTKPAKFSVINIAKVGGVVLIAWSFLAAVLQSLVISQIGTTVGVNGVFTTAAGGITFFGSLFSGLFVGLILMFFLALLMTIWAVGYTFFSDSMVAETKHKFERINLIAVVVVAIYTLTASAYSAVIVGGAATAAHAATWIVTLGFALTFVVSLLPSLFSGLVILILLSVFCLAILFVVALFSGKQVEENVQQELTETEPGNVHTVDSAKAEQIKGDAQSCVPSDQA
ncbi:MAG: hypothetical protein IAF58_01450 [Leptolyngbya sp.]|nr:hypothetical protein [Candidatus Melainabacteria bacterium]